MKQHEVVLAGRRSGKTFKMMRDLAMSSFVNERFENGALRMGGNNPLSVTTWDFMPKAMLQMQDEISWEEIALLIAEGKLVIFWTDRHVEPDRDDPESPRWISDHINAFWGMGPTSTSRIGADAHLFSYRSGGMCLCINATNIISVMATNINIVNAYECFLVVTKATEYFNHTLEHYLRGMNAAFLNEG